MKPLNNTFDVSRPDITPYAFSRPFWEATRAKKLVVQYCPISGRYQFLPRPVSIFTGTRALEWREVSGHGELFSFTIAWRGPDVFRGHEPYAVGMVTLDVGVNIIGNVVNCDRAALRIGMRVEPHWHPMSDGKHLLMFQPEHGLG